MIALNRAIENLKFSSQRYKENVFPLVLAQFLVLFLTLLIVSPALVMLLSMPFLFMDMGALTGLMSTLASVLFFVILSGLVNVAFTSGLFGMAHQALTDKASINTLFSTTKSRGITTVASSILYSLAVFVPLTIPSIVLMLSVTDPGLTVIGLVLLLLFLVPSVFIGIRLSLFVQAIVVSDMSAVEALKTSNSVAKVYFRDLFILYLILCLINLLLSLIPLLGTLLSYLFLAPLMWISLVKFYVDRTTTVSSSSQKKSETGPQT